MRKKGRFYAYTLARDIALISVPKCMRFVAILRIRRNRRLWSRWTQLGNAYLCNFRLH